MPKLNIERVKRPYKWVHPESKRLLLEMVLKQGHRILNSSRHLCIPYSSAKMIISRHKVAINKKNELQFHRVSDSCSPISTQRGPKMRQVFKVHRISKPRWMEQNKRSLTQDHSKHCCPTSN